jgi:hypothetical protein
VPSASSSSAKADDPVITGGAISIGGTEYWVPRLRGARRVCACGAPHVFGGGAKKHRRLPSGRLQRQNAPSGDGCASLNGTTSFISRNT